MKERLYMLCAMILSVLIFFAYVVVAAPKVENPETTVAATESETIETTAPATEPETTYEVTETGLPKTEVEPVLYFDVPLSEDLQDHIFRECEKYNIDPAIVVSIIKKESSFRDYVMGDNGNSYGLMQINKKWHVTRMKKLGCTDLLDPYQNVTVGINYLAELIGKGKSIEWALMAYNGGPSYANRMEANGKVSDYAKKVLSYSKNFTMYEKEGE